MKRDKIYKQIKDMFGVYFAKSSVGWNTYITGMQLNCEQFRKEVLQAAQVCTSNAEEKISGKRNA
jgi:hypothetical protein